MPDPYEVDDEGNPVVEADDARTPRPVARRNRPSEALRRQVEQTLRFMRIQTAVGFVVLLILIVVLSDIRGVMVLVTIVFLLTSLRRLRVPQPAPSTGAGRPRLPLRSRSNQKAAFGLSL